MIDEKLERLFTVMGKHEVACLLMGGQACVLYGGAEFSKDVDFVIFADSSNLEKLNQAMLALEAEVIAIPPFRPEYLEMGLAVHFRCLAEGMDSLRVDVMSKMRGVDSFPELWERRVAVPMDEGEVNLLHISDLVNAKKTQRNKDWPMIQRLLEVFYLNKRASLSPEEIEFCFLELRTVELLIELAERFPDTAASLTSRRKLLKFAAEGDFSLLERELMEEMLKEKEKDRVHWKPLKEKLNELRANRPRKA